MPARHLIVGGGTAGLNAIRTIREEERMRGLDPSEITLVSAERPYSRMVLPYYLGGTISESHVYTAPPAALTAWKVKPLLGRRAKALDPAARTLTLADDPRNVWLKSRRLNRSAHRARNVAGHMRTSEACNEPSSRYAHSPV